MTIRVFISHSSNDEQLAVALVALLRASLNLSTRDIRCTSEESCQLDVGSQIDSALKSDLIEANVCVGIITPRSIESAYVLFELGACWGAGTFIAPILAAGAGADLLPGPLRQTIAASCDSRSEMCNLINKLAEELTIQPEPPAAFEDKLTSFQRLNESLVMPRSTQTDRPVTEQIRVEQTGDALISDDHIRPTVLVPTVVDVIKREASRFVKSDLVQLRIENSVNGGKLEMAIPSLDQTWTLLEFCFHRHGKKPLFYPSIAHGYPVSLTEYLSGDDKTVHEIEDAKHLEEVLRDTFASAGAKSKVENVLLAAKTKVAEGRSH